MKLSSNKRLQNICSHKRGIDMKKQRHGIRHFSLYFILAVSILAIASTQLGWIYHDEPSYITVQVQSGDTIWNLASETANSQTDIRYTVHEIIEINHLKNNQDIYPGQQLQIPVAAGQERLVKDRLSLQAK